MDVVKLLIAQWGGAAAWTQDGRSQPHEAHYLKLDCTKANQRLNWYARWTLEQAIDALITWERASRNGSDMLFEARRQINSYTTNRN